MKKKLNFWGLMITFPLMFFLMGMEKKGENARLLFCADRDDSDNLRAWEIHLKSYHRTAQGIEAKGNDIGNLRLDLGFGHQLGLDFDYDGDWSVSEDSQIFVTPEGNGSLNIKYTYRKAGKFFHDITLSCQTKEPYYGGGIYCELRDDEVNKGEKFYVNGLWSLNRTPPQSNSRFSPKCK
ncbi:MAG: hypothetical protein RLZZ338_2102 [Cyanobacteriota bacterium]|jgi:hypothetical protein